MGDVGGMRRCVQNWQPLGVALISLEPQASAAQGRSVVTVEDIPSFTPAAAATMNAEW